MAMEGGCIIIYDICMHRSGLEEEEEEEEKGRGGVDLNRQVRETE